MVCPCPGLGQTWTHIQVFQLGLTTHEQDLPHGLPLQHHWIDSRSLIRDRRYLIGIQKFQEGEIQKREHDERILGRKWRR